jgi:hypothetical protein
MASALITPSATVNSYKQYRSAGHYGHAPREARLSDHSALLVSMIETHSLWPFTSTDWLLSALKQPFPVCPVRESGLKRRGSLTFVDVVRGYQGDVDSRICESHTS